MLTDLSRLTIVEKSYGFRLESVRDADGHADTATALAIALPTAIEYCLHGGVIVFESLLNGEPFDGLPAYDFRF